MVTFLDHNPFWKGATLFYHADTLPYWRKRKNLPQVAAAVDDASLRELAVLIRSYFHRTEGRGNNCVVEPFRRGSWTTSLPIPRTIRNIASSGWTGSSTAGRTIPPSR